MDIYKVNPNLPNRVLQQKCGLAGTYYFYGEAPKIESKNSTNLCTAVQLKAQ